MIYFGSRRNTYSCCSEPLFTLCLRQRAIACPLGTSHATFILCSRYILKCQIRELLSTPSLNIILRISNLVEVCSFKDTLIPFISTMEFPKKGCRLHHDDLKQRNEDINVLDRPLREEQALIRRTARFFTKHFPLSLPLKSRDEISCSGGEL